MLYLPPIRKRLNKKIYREFLTSNKFTKKKPYVEEVEKSGAE